MGSSAQEKGGDGNEKKNFYADALMRLMVTLISVSMYAVTYTSLPTASLRASWVEAKKDEISDFDRNGVGTGLGVWR